MVRVSTLVLAAILIGGCATTPTRPVAPAYFLAKDGVAQARIVVAEEAPASTKYAAEELQRFLGEITGGTFEIVPDTERLRDGDIVLGCNAQLGKATREKHLYDTIGNESYVIESTGKHLIIAGGEPRGTLYGVYGLLEDHLGCRWFTPTVSRIPKSATLTLGRFSQKEQPVLEYREPFVMDCYDGDWAARNWAWIGLRNEAYFTNRLKCFYGIGACAVCLLIAFITIASAPTIETRPVFTSVDARTGTESPEELKAWRERALRKYTPQTSSPNQ